MGLSRDLLGRLVVSLGLTVLSSSCSEQTLSSILAGSSNAKQPVSMSHAPLVSSRKRVHQIGNHVGNPVTVAEATLHSLARMQNSADETSPPHAVVTQLRRLDSNYMASPTKFTTANGEISSFR